MRLVCETKAASPLSLRRATETTGQKLIHTHTHARRQTDRHTFEHKISIISHHKHENSTTTTTIEDNK